jgi:hypothetical protein
MLTRLTRKLRWRAAVVIAALYAVCSVTPALALAFTDASTAAHCLTDDHHGIAKSHSHHHHHGEDANHSHSDDAASPADADQSGHQHGKCCGIFCITALPGSAHLPLGQPIHASAVTQILQEHLAGRGPDRIDRPPIASLSL